MEWVLGGDERNVEVLAGWVDRLGASSADVAPRLRPTSRAGTTAAVG
jgi:hypothetical protein